MPVPDRMPVPDPMAAPDPIAGWRNQPVPAEASSGRRKPDQQK
jgi:hypothetical protein